MSQHVKGDATARKNQPVFRGCLMYFPDALLAVAELSRIGNEQHNPGTELHWDKAKSTDEADALVRHLLDAGTIDNDGVRHSTKVAWRALALLQREIEAERDGSAVLIQFVSMVGKRRNSHGVIVPACPITPPCSTTNPDSVCKQWNAVTCVVPSL